MLKLVQLVRLILLILYIVWSACFEIWNFREKKTCGIYKKKVWHLEGQNLTFLQKQTKTLKMNMKST